MRTKKLIIYLIFLSLIGHAQPNKSLDYVPEGMIFVPKGSCNLRNDSISKIIAVSAFWMSNEITNKEYRAFTDYAFRHPEDSLFLTDFNGQKSGNTYEQLVSFLIDKLALSKEYPLNSEQYNKCKNYFTDKAFNNFPVIGVSQKGANLYCKWKTQMEKKKKRLTSILDYKLPSEAEWCRVAEYCKDSEVKGSDNLQVVKYGKKNKLGLYNIFGNVSEWTSTSDTSNQMIVVKGTSWKDNQLTDNRLLFNPNTKTSYIGFRIIRSYFGTHK